MTTMIRWDGTLYSYNSNTQLMTEEKNWQDVSGDGGVLKVIIKAAPSAESEDSDSQFPQEGEEVYVNYTGRLLSGVEFDTNLMFGSAYSKTFNFIIGVSKVVKGMNVALKTMRQGETALFRFREDYAYGKTGSPGRGTSPAIPSNATIEFEIDFVNRAGKGVLSAEEAKKLAEDERRANIIAVREEKARLREEERLQKDEAKAAAIIIKNSKKEKASAAEGGADIVEVFDARWAKSLKPNDLKKALKDRELSTQGTKKELLARLIADLPAKT